MAKDRGGTAEDARLSRPHLLELLDEAPHRLITLIGPAGSGKTTLLTQWLSDRPAAWHTVSASDRSLSTFARTIIDELRAATPGISPELRLAMEGSRGPDSGGGETAVQADALAAAVCQDLDAALTRDLVLVLDDCHRIDASAESAPFVAALCRHAPARLHVVLASREPPPFPTARMLLQGEAAELTPEMFAFTEEEVFELLSAQTEGADADTARALHQYTGGWPVAVVFAIRALGRGSVVTLEDLPSDATLFDYLADEVIGSESESSLQALRLASELPWVTAALADHIEPKSGLNVLDPEWRSVYVTPVTRHPHAVAVTPLVRSFLRSRYPLEAAERVDLLQQAAEWYEQNGALDDALTCLIRADDPGPLADRLRRWGSSMLTAGLARPVIDAIDLIPDSSGDRDLLVLEAEARQVLGDWEGAMRCYRLLAPESGPIPAEVAWRLGLLHHMRGDSHTALDVYSRGSLDSGEPADLAALLGWMASAHWLRGERDEAKRLADEALALARSANDSRSLATAHTVLAMVAALDGDRASNDIHYLRALEHAERSRDVQQTIRIRSNRGSHFLEEGDYDRALAELEIALRLADLSGFELWRAMSLSNQGEVRFARGELDEAIGNLEEARSIFRRLGSSLESYPLAHLGDVYSVRGDIALARAAYEQAIALAEKPSDLQALVPALAGLARIVVADDPDGAAAMTARASAVVSVLGHVKALLAQGWVAHARGDLEEAARLVTEVSSTARARRDNPGLAAALELEAAVSADSDRARSLLEQSRQLWASIGAQLGVARVEATLATVEGGTDGALMAEVAADRLEALGAKLPALEARRLARTLGHAQSRPVGIRTLGGFAVTRMGEPVASKEWQSKVAREVLWMLVANRGRPLHREVIMDRLWPDEDPAKAANRLSVALTTVRNVLDPDRREGGDRFLAADRDGVSLILDAVSVDLESFFSQATLGLGLVGRGDLAPGLVALRAAEATYVGEFLEEEPYAEWAVGTREEARSMYLTVAAALAAAESRDGDHSSAARRYLRMLERDAYNEPAHLGLVSAMTAAGRHGTARRLYGLYVSRMAELGVEPSSFPERA